MWSDLMKVLGVVAVLTATGCAVDVPPSDPATTTVVVAEVDTGLLDRLCDTIRSGVDSYAAGFADAYDDIPEGRQEYCFSSRGDGTLDYAAGMLRVHPFDAADVRRYRTAASEEDREATACLMYWTTTDEDDALFNPGPVNFNDVDDSGGQYCSAAGGKTAVVAFAIPGAALVLEFEVAGTDAGRTTDVRELRSAVLPEVFARLPG